MQSDTTTSNLDNQPTPPAFPDATQVLVDGSSFVIDTTFYQQRVARRIQELENEIRALKSCHNAATMACRLPVEILSRVFLFVTLPKPNPWAWGNEKSGSYAWIRATHVCRHWRSAAITCASLWTYLSFEDLPEMVETMLERSRGAPVDVLWRHHMISSSGYSSLAVSLPQVNRLRSLKISSSPGGNLDTLLQFLCLPHWIGCPTMLEELELQIYQSTATRLRLPEGFFQGGFPVLSSLKVSGCVVGLNFISYPTNLTFLDLRGKIAAPITAKILLDTFGRMLLLHTLYLSNCLDFSPDIVAKVPLVTFPSLRYLGVEDGSKNIDQFLRLTRCNTAVTVILNFLERQTHPADAQQSLGNVVTWWGYSTPDTKLHVRHFNQGGELELELDFDPESGSTGADASPGKNHLSVALTRWPPLRECLDILRERFDFQTLTSLSSDEPLCDRWYSDAWRFFAGLPALQRISLSSPIPAEIRDLFMVLQEDAAPLGTDHAVTFPSLSIIKISCKFFNDGLPGSMTFGQFVASFTAIAKRRRLSPCPISELDIGDSEIVEAAEVELLRECNPGLSVLWDGDL